jgi:outer membrane biosynthesis protein TonB
MKTRPRAKAPFWLLGIIALLVIGILVESFILATAINQQRLAPAVALSVGASATPKLAVPPLPTLTELPTKLLVTSTKLQPIRSIVSPTKRPPMPSSTPSPSPSPSTSPTEPLPTPTGTPSPRPTASETEQPPTPTETPNPSPTASQTEPPPAPTDTPSPTASATSSVAQLHGRLVLNGTPAGAGTILLLENTAYQAVATQSLDANGRFAFGQVAPVAGGYQVAFDQAKNDRYDVSQVVSWAWIGPISASGGVQIDVGDLEIGLLGLQPIQPFPDSSLSMTSISAGTPITFEWTAYPQAQTYWLDLTREDQQGQQIVWQSALVPENHLTFDGTLRDGSKIPPGQYGWAVGAQRQIGQYNFVAYGYLAGLQIVP